MLESLLAGSDLDRVMVLRVEPTETRHLDQGPRPFGGGTAPGVLPHPGDRPRTRGDHPHGGAARRDGDGQPRHRRGPGGDVPPVRRGRRRDPRPLRRSGRDGGRGPGSGRVVRCDRGPLPGGAADAAGPTGGERTGPPRGGDERRPRRPGDAAARGDRRARTAVVELALDPGPRGGGRLRRSTAGGCPRHVRRRERKGARPHHGQGPGVRRDALREGCRRWRSSASSTPGRSATRRTGASSRSGAVASIRTAP